METLLTTMLCLPVADISDQHAIACSRAAEAFVLQANLRPRLKQIDRRARRRAEDAINKNYLAVALFAASAAREQQLSYTLKASRQSAVKALTIAITTEPAYRLTLTLKEF